MNRRCCSLLALLWSALLLIFHAHKLSLDRMTGAWLRPVVPAVLSAASLGVAAALMSPDPAVTIMVVSYMLWEIGRGLSLLILPSVFTPWSYANCLWLNLLSLLSCLESL